MAALETLFLSTTPGLEPALADEARALGEVTAVPGGVELRGPAGLHRRANLELRTASRVLLELARFPARDTKALREGLARVRWDAVLAKGGALALECVSRDRNLPERALAEAIPKSWPRGDAGLAARVRVEAGLATVAVDSSGELLYRRGYRQETSHAPLRETLGAGLLRRAGYDPSRPLWDPMCGSGTLPIEAAWIAQDRAPGLGRTFAFERWPSHDATAWAREKAAAQARIRSSLPTPIFASDKNAGALGVARRNARRAGVDGLLTLARLDATAPQRDFKGPGLVIANLPYGKRVGRDAELESLYRGFAAALKQGVPGWRVALFAADAKLLESTGIAWIARHRVDNGGIPCVLAVGTL